MCEFFGLDKSALIDGVTKTTSMARGEVIHRLHSIAEAEDHRDALAKVCVASNPLFHEPHLPLAHQYVLSQVIYGRLFDWIVFRVNELLQPKRRDSHDNIIAILDIFGFENFATNSFEQVRRE